MAVDQVAQLTGTCLTAATIVGSAGYAAVDDELLVLSIQPVADGLRATVQGRAALRGAAMSLGVCDPPVAVGPTAPRLVVASLYGVGIQVLDVTDAAQPSTLAYLPLASSVAKVAVKGDHAYVASFDNHLRTVALRDPAGPRVVADLTTAGPLWDVVAGQWAAYALDQHSGLIPLDLSEPARPIAGVALAMGAVGGTCTLQEPLQRLLVVTEQGDLVTVDIAAPLRPVRLSQVPLPIPVHGQTHIVCSGRSAVVFGFGALVPISYPPGVDRPEFGRPVTTMPDYAAQDQLTLVQAVGKHLVVASSKRGLLSYEADALAQPVARELLATPPPVFAAAVSGEQVYAGALPARLLLLPHASELVSLDLATPARPAYATVPIRGNVMGLVAFPQYLLAAVYPDRVQVYRCAALDPAQVGAVRPLAEVAVAGPVERLVANERLAAVAMGQGGVAVLDIGRVERPRLLATLLSDGAAHGVALDGDRLYVGAQQGVTVVDCTTDAPEVVCQIPTASPAVQVAVDAGLLYVCTLRHGLAVFDLATGETPARIGSAPLDIATAPPVVQGPFLVVPVTNGLQADLQAWDLAEPQTPQLARRWHLPRGASGLCRLGQRHMLVALQYGGLAMVSLPPREGPSVGRQVAARTTG